MMINMLNYVLSLFLWGAEEFWLICVLDTGPEDYRDAPIALQVVGQHGKDEETLAMMEMIDNVVNGSN